MMPKVLGHQIELPLLVNLSFPNNEENKFSLTTSPQNELVTEVTGAVGNGRTSLNPFRLCGIQHQTLRLQEQRQQRTSRARVNLVPIQSGSIV